MATPDRAPSSMHAVTRRRFLALGGLTAAAVAAHLAQAPGASAATAQLSLDFENGSLGAPITQHAGAALGRGYAHSGTLGCRLDPATTAGRAAYLVVDRSGFALDRPYATFAMYFRLVTRPYAGDSYMNLFEIGNTSTTSPKSQFTVFFRDNRLMCDFGYVETMDLGPVPNRRGVAPDPGGRPLRLDEVHRRREP